MRIVVSAEENRGLESQVSHHFGRCPYFVMAEVDGEEITLVETIENPFFEQHSPGQVPRFVSEQNADVMISGGMGRRAIEFFQQFDIQTATGASGNVGQALRQYVSGGLTGVQPCHDSVEHEEHGHHHSFF